MSAPSSFSKGGGGQGLPRPRARGTHHPYQKGFSHLWWCRAAPSPAPSPLILPGPPEGRARTCLISRTVANPHWDCEKGARPESSPHLPTPLPPGCESSVEIGLGWPRCATCPPQAPGTPSPEPQGAHLTACRNRDHPVRLEEAAEQRRGSSAVSA